MNQLSHKTIIWNGDSICAGNKRPDDTPRDNWCTRIGKSNNMSFKNYAVGGGTIAENTPMRKDGNPRHSVSATLDQMFQEYPDADYVIFEGGTNDADLIGSIIDGNSALNFGCVDLMDFSGEYDCNTFCGALESVFCRSVRYWKGKKIGFIVAQKMGTDPAVFRNRYAYLHTAIEICKKWGIPYLNLWDDCYLNPMLKDMYDPNKDNYANEACGNFYIDGQHLTKHGYQVTTDLIENWLITL